MVRYVLGDGRNDLSDCSELPGFGVLGDDSDAAARLKGAIAGSAVAGGARGPAATRGRQRPQPRGGGILSG